MRKEFNTSYDQAISLIKQLKNSNDYLNRAVGVQSPNTVALRIKRQQTVIQQMLQKIETHIQKLQQSYLDPDTARKIGTVKQQFRIQRDRRKQLLHTAEVQQKHEKYLDRSSKDSQITTFSSVSTQYTHMNNHSNRARQRQDQQVPKKTKQNSLQQQIEYDQIDCNFEIQHKILQQRNVEINHVSKILMNVHSIIQETSNLTVEQGEKIDIIGEELFQVYRNVHQARQNLSQANEHQQRARRNYVYFSLFVLLGVAISLIILLV